MSLLIQEDILPVLEQASRVLIMTHLRPDGDALGSSFGMCAYLRSLGKEAQVLLPEEPPERYLTFCPERLRSMTLEELDCYDLLLLLDCANPERLGSAGIPVEELRRRHFLSVDHHPNNCVRASFEFLDPQACSTCEIAARIAQAGPHPVSAECATFWLAGMMTDTGCFRFSNTDGDALRIAAKLLDLGADLEGVVNTLFFNKSLRQLNFEAELIHERLQFACNGRFAYAYIPEEMLEKYHFRLREDEGLIDILRGVDTVKIAMLVHRQPEGFKISLRSKDHVYPVRPLAARYHGGGHDMAAGATISADSWEAVEALMLKEVSALLGC